MLRGRRLEQVRGEALRARRVREQRGGSGVRVGTLLARDVRVDRAAHDRMRERQAVLEHARGGERAGGGVGVLDVRERFGGRGIGAVTEHRDGAGEFERVGIEAPLDGGRDRARPERRDVRGRELARELAQIERVPAGGRVARAGERGVDVRARKERPRAFGGERRRCQHARLGVGRELRQRGIVVLRAGRHRGRIGTPSIRLARNARKRRDGSSADCAS